MFSIGCMVECWLLKSGDLRYYIVWIVFYLDDGKIIGVVIIFVDVIFLVDVEKKCVLLIEEVVNCVVNIKNVCLEEV